METYYSLKMKRKDLDDVYDEFSDFSLSSPARKIRRLDAELPPIIEEVEEPEIPIAFAQPATDPSFGNNGGNRGVVIEELPSVPENEERALVLFKPMNTHLVHSPSNFSVKVDPLFMNGFKTQKVIVKLCPILEGRLRERKLSFRSISSADGSIFLNPNITFVSASGGQALWGNQTNAFRPADNEAMPEDDSGSTEECLAVVPWVPSQLPSARGAEVHGQADMSDMMDAEEMEGVMMDVEDSSVNAELRTTVEVGAVSLNEGLHPWQQQHCMTTQLPQNTSTPIVWYR